MRKSHYTFINKLPFRQMHCDEQLIVEQGVESGTPASTKAGFCEIKYCGPQLAACGWDEVW